MAAEFAATGLRSKSLPRELPGLFSWPPLLSGLSAEPTGGECETRIQERKGDHR